MNSWKNTFDKIHKPIASDLKSFFTPKTMDLFNMFCEKLYSKTGFGISGHSYTKKNGWVFKIGPKYIRLANLIIKDNASFYVDEYCVKETMDVNNAIKNVLKLCNDDFKEKEKKLEENRIKRNQNQIIRSKKRIIREKDELEKIINLINKEKFNKFKWAPRVSLVKLKRLYQSSARMLLDENLLDDIGYTIYYRCIQGKEERDLYYNGKLKCHHCKKILPFNNKNDFLQCECGYQYIPREYGRSYQNECMPHGRAQPVFDKFME